MSSAGDFFTTNLGDLPVVIVRDTGGAIRAFANVCRHRGSEVVLECAGNRKTLQCHYHGWTYNLDGTLRTAPRENEQREFAKETLSLAPFAVETWGPLIFVNPSPAAAPLRDVLGELPAIFERAGIDFGQMRMLRRDVYEIASNWKIVVENFNECYHCPIAHPKFSEVIDTTAYHVETDHEYFSTYYGPIVGSPGDGVTYATLWPNILFSLYGNPPNLQATSIVPIDAGHSRQVVDYFFTGDPSESQIRSDVEFSDLVTRGRRRALRIRAARPALGRDRARQADAVARTRHPALPEARLPIPEPRVGDFSPAYAPNCLRTAANACSVTFRVCSMSRSVCAAEMNQLWRGAK